jgi:gamma-glutamyltranspeptidase
MSNVGAVKGEQGSRRASRREILGKGGNAVVAAVATALASCGADPGKMGIAE